ncbi:MAG: hypothetical protein QXY40_06395 [Candidatus Methanomethylicia archaeon]
MYIKLDDIELMKRVDENGVIREIRSIRNVSLSGRRRIVELKIPGLQGNILQDLGRDPLLIYVEGLLTGINAKNTFQEISSKFKLGKPIQFLSDIPSISDVSEVVIESLKAYLISGEPLSYWYTLVLREHKSSSQRKSEIPSQEKEAKIETEELTKQIRREVEEKFKISG